MRSQYAVERTIGGVPAWPCEADFILSTLETAFSPDLDSRMREREQFRVAAQLEMIREGPAGNAISVYTRDVSADGLGFISREQIPTGSKAMLHVSTPANAVLHIECTVYRCRPVASGWFEGAVSFTQPQRALAARTTTTTERD